MNEQERAADEKYRALSFASHAMDRATKMLDLITYERYPMTVEQETASASAAASLVQASLALRQRYDVPQGPIPAQPVTLHIRKLSPDAHVPTRMSATAAGLDLFARIPDEDWLDIAPGERFLIATGIAVAIPEGFEGQIRPRSGLAPRHGITVQNSPGTIDSDYRGELAVILINHGHKSFRVADGDRIAQLVIAPVVMPEIVVVDELPETERGEQGFGSTGG